MTENEKFLSWLDELDERGYNFVELVDGIENAKLPKEFYDWCLNYGIEQKKALKFIVIDFLARNSKGNSKADSTVLGKLLNSDKLSLREKKLILEICGNGDDT